ncbi:MAG: hypothetical protein LBB54_06795 [Cellulomonadaceae bacterium]|nr:hypothetical protein [Cellulomonadaceae bacterium]
MPLSTRLASIPLLTALLAAVVAAGAWIGWRWLWVVVLIMLVAAIGQGWGMLLDLPFIPGTVAVVAFAGLAGLLVAHTGGGTRILRNLPLVIAMALIVAFFAEMMRPDGRPHLLASVSGTAAGAVVAASVAGWLGLAHSGGQAAHIIVTGAVALALAAAASLYLKATFLGASPWRLFAAIMVVGAGVGTLIGALLFADVSPGRGLLTGAVASLPYALSGVLVSKDGRSSFTDNMRVRLAGAAASVALAGMVLFIVS